SGWPCIVGHLGPPQEGGPGCPAGGATSPCVRRCFRATPLSLSQKGGRDWKSATTTAGSPDPLTKLAATRDPTAQMGFPRLLPDRTHDRLPMGSVRPVGVNSYPRRAFISSLCIRALQ